jgi:hypothetical protein
MPKTRDTVWERRSRRFAFSACGAKDLDKDRPVVGLNAGAVWGAVGELMSDVVDG